MLLLVFLVLLLGLFHPAVAVENKTKIHTEKTVFTIGEHYEFFQGYSINITQPSPTGNKISMEILADGKIVKEDIVVNKENIFQYTIEYKEDEDEDEDEIYVIFDIILEKIYFDDWAARLNITQYVDPSRSTSEFIIFNEDYTLEKNTFFSLKEDYKLILNQMDSDYAFIELYRQGVMVKEQEMEINDTFDYSVTVDEREYLIITFDLKTIFKGTSRNVVEINHVYQFETPPDIDPVETDTEVDDNGVSDSNDVASNNDSNRSDNNDVSPNNDSDNIEESNTQIPDNNQTVDIEDSTSDNGNSIFGIGVFLVTVMIVIIWADLISKRRRK
ncbi:MAG: S-layer protein domain-containing protein [Euryarchaeota archaeon]|nr:S-layer protein domain-containing protein [Euryarchaeota archaeon]